ncbi:MAG: hypothetical protein NT013_18590 [Planctomycetia bacterium]|nr:hypothetical protein [Planctomycetia bacterium]
MNTNTSDNSSEGGITACQRFLRRYLPYRFLPDEEYVEAVRKRTERIQRWGIAGLISFAALNLALISVTGCLLVFALQNVPFGNNVPIQQMAIAAGFMVGIVLGVLIGKCEANFLHSFIAIVTGMRADKLLVQYFDLAHADRMGNEDVAT